MRFITNEFLVLTESVNNRSNLPRGSLEEGEALSEAMKREFLEETRLESETEENIGVIDFKLTWVWRDFTDVHHIAV